MDSYCRVFGVKKKKGSIAVFLSQQRERERVAERRGVCSYALGMPLGKQLEILYMSCVSAWTK